MSLSFLFPPSPAIFLISKHFPSFLLTHSPPLNTKKEYWADRIFKTKNLIRGDRYTKFHGFLIDPSMVCSLPSYSLSFISTK